MKTPGKFKFVTYILIQGFVLFLNLSAKAQSAPRQKVTQSIEWLSLNSNIKLNKRYGLTFDMQNRFVQDFSTMQHMVRGGFEVYITPKLSVVPVGYSYVWNYLYGKQPASIVNNERRIWQHVSYKHSINRVAISHRLRLEERFIESHTTNGDGALISDGYTNHQTRLRYRLMANIPLNHKKMEPKTYYISIWDEAFVSRGAKVTYTDPDQNRLFAGVGYQFTKKLAIQSGYFYQALVKSNGAKQEDNKGVMLQVNYNFDFSK